MKVRCNQSSPLKSIQPFIDTPSKMIRARLLTNHSPALAAGLGSPHSEELPKQIADLKAEREKAASDLVDVTENLEKVEADLKMQTDANALLRLRLDHAKQEAEEVVADLEEWRLGLQDANDSLQQLADDLAKERNVAVAELERTKKALEVCMFLNLSRCRVLR
jgi:septal ring factor EnvC (AmiA/AmiB activator)